MVLLSILICTIPEREESFNDLLDILYRQSKASVQILTDNSPKELKSIGKKRNDLVERADGKYFCFIDDDDTVSNNYVAQILEGCKKDVDCVSLRGIITWNFDRPELFEHSIKYNAYATTLNDIKYERFPNHLNAIRSKIGKQFRFPDNNFGEDTDWATQIYNSGLLKTEHFIDNVLYHYNYKTK